MPANNTTYDWSSLAIPDIYQAFETVVKAQPTVISMIPVETNRSMYATNTKLEWLQYTNSPTSYSLAAGYTAGDGEMTLASVDGISVGNLLGFTKASKASATFKVRVTAVNTSTKVISFGTVIGTDEDLSSGDTAYLIGQAIQEKSSANIANNVLPEKEYNYLQIFRRDFQLARTLVQSANYGFANGQNVNSEKLQNNVNFQANEQLMSLTRELNRSLIEGVRYAGSAGDDHRTMNGLLTYLESDSNTQYDASSADISQDILNNAVAKAIKTNGANGQDLTVLLCNITQARKISALNRAADTNPVIMRDDTTAGDYVARYQTDLAGTNGGSLSTVVVDQNMPEDKVVIFSPRKTRIVPMQDMYMWESTPNDLDGVQYSILGEMTLEWRDWKSQGIAIENLKIA